MTLTLHEAVTLSVQLHMIPRNLSRKDVADALGITSSAVTARFKGRTKWSLADVDALCDLFGLDAAELVTPPTLFSKTIPAYEAIRHMGRGPGSGTATHESQRTAALYALAA